MKLVITVTFTNEEQSYKDSIVVESDSFTTLSQLGIGAAVSDMTRRILDDARHAAFVRKEAIAKAEAKAKKKMSAGVFSMMDYPEPIA